MHLELFEELGVSGAVVHNQDFGETVTTDWLKLMKIADETHTLPTEGLVCSTRFMKSCLQARVEFAKQIVTGGSKHRNFVNTHPICSSEIRADNDCFVCADHTPFGSRKSGTAVLETGFVLLASHTKGSVQRCRRLIHCRGGASCGRDLKQLAKPFYQSFNDGGFANACLFY